MKVNQQHKGENFLEYVLQILSDCEQKNLTYYSISSFVESFEKFGLTILDVDSLKLWTASMFLEGMKLNTVKRYCGRLHTIYNGWRSPGEPDPFTGIQSAFDSGYEADSADALHNLGMLRRLLGRDVPSEDSDTADIFFYLLYDAQATLLDAADTTFDNAPTYCAQIDDIVKTRDASYGRRYLFPLGQSKARPTQIARELGERLARFMRGCGMRVAEGRAREEITAMWTAAAMECGVDIRDIRAVIPAVPYRHRALSLIPKTDISGDRKHEIICKVADFLDDNTPRWFVMKLRKGVGADDIRERLERELPGRLRTMELYYPTRTVTQKTGGRLRSEEIPVVPDMLFFRTRYNRVAGLFAGIGDMAWCFRESGLPDSRYSVIPHAEMSGFQRCVGQFTADVRVGLAGAGSGLGIGRMVRITGGVMKGYRGRIEDVGEESGTRRFFLRISSDSELNWTAEVDDVYIEPLDSGE